MLVNKYFTSCTACGIDLLPMSGFVFKKNNDFIGICRGLQCIKQTIPEELPKYQKFIDDENKEKNSFDREAVLRAEKAGLFKYQIEGVKWLTRQKNCLLADSCGLGKTPQILISLDLSFGTLVVVPSHLKLNWRDEAAKWRPELKVYIVKDGKTFKYPEKGEIVITTYGLLPEKFKLPPNKRKNPNLTDEDYSSMAKTVLIFDEVQALKNNKTIKFKIAREMMKLAYKTIGITGTPILNRELELWNMCRVIGIDTIIFENFSNFLYLFGGRQGTYGYTFSQPRKETPKILQRAMLRREIEDVEIELPDKIYIEIQAELPDKVKKVFDNAWDVYKKSSYYEKEELPSFEFLSKEKEALAMSKVSCLNQLLDDLESKDIVPLVFSAHQKPIDEVGKRKGWKTIKGVGSTSSQKHKIKDEFQDGKLKGLAVTIKSAGSGLTLTHSRVSVFNDLDWVPANNVQAEHRNHRIGQKAEKVIIYHIVADHPLERHIRKLIFKKMSLAKNALNVVKEDFAPNENDKESDFIERLGNKKKKEKILSREAIISRLKFWPTSDKEVSDERLKQLEEISNTFNPIKNDAQIIRLIKFAGLIEQPEKKCFDAILSLYETPKKLC